jgi:hypothetical protein
VSWDSWTWGVVEEVFPFDTKVDATLVVLSLTPTTAPSPDHCP